MTATVAEVQLLQSHFEDAAHIYKAAVAIAPGRVDDHRSTWQLASRLLQCLMPSAEQAQEVAGAFSHIASERPAAIA